MKSIYHKTIALILIFLLPITSILGMDSKNSLIGNFNPTTFKVGQFIKPSFNWVTETYNSYITEYPYTTSIVIGTAATVGLAGLGYAGWHFYKTKSDLQSMAPSIPNNNLHIPLIPSSEEKTLYFNMLHRIVREQIHLYREEKKREEKKRK